jgi:hypothetical protein
LSASISRQRLYGALVKHPLFLDEVLVHELSETVGVAKVTYYPVDGELKNIRIGVELGNGTRRDFPLVELRSASPEEEATLQFQPDSAAEDSGPL